MTTLTRLQVETLLIGPDLLSGRRGATCAVAGLYVPASVVLGTVPALSGPISWGLGFCGAAAVDPTSPTNADISLLAAGQSQAFIDISDLKLLESCLGNWAKWDQSIALGSQKFGQFRESLQNEVNALRLEYRNLYGYGIGSPSLGQMDLGFAASESCYWGPY